MGEPPAGGKLALMRTGFDLQSVENLTMGAGVVPVARDREGEVCVLLGRERFLPYWRGSCRWCGFEGSRKQGETVVQTATRECHEESLGTLAESIEALAQQRYWRRIVLRIARDARVERYHCTYVTVVPWDEELPERFVQTRLSLEHVDRAVQEWNYMRPPAFGDAHIGEVWHDPDDGAVRVARLAADAPDAPWSASPDDPAVQVAAFRGDHGAKVLAWSKLRDRVERLLHDHPSLHVSRDARWARVQSVALNVDFLEKDTIRWWTMRELQGAIQNRGVHHSDRLRPYFLPVLQTILTEIEERPPTQWPAPVSPRSDP